MLPLRFIALDESATQALKYIDVTTPSVKVSVETTEIDSYLENSKYQNIFIFQIEYISI